MPKFAANLTMLFQELPFLERFAAASDAGFNYVEYLFPYAYDAQQLKRLLDENALQQVLFNLPPGDWDSGERGIACLPDRQDEFKAGVDSAIHYAHALNVEQVNCLAGLLPSHLDESQAWEVFAENINYAATRLQQANVRLVVEAINSKVDMPGFFLDTIEKSKRLLTELKHPNLGFQFDLYHMHIMHGDLIASLNEIWPFIQHIQFADAPGRHQPGTGNINLAEAILYLDQKGYQGFVSAEYIPKEDTVGSLAWLRTFN